MTQQATAAQRREALLAHVREGIRTGLYPPGASLPSLRDLGAAFSLSRDTAQVALRPLVESGVLMAAARTGMFVADQSPTPIEGVFVLVARQLDRLNPDSHLPEVQRGFERRVSQRGGVSVLWIDDEGQGLPDDLAGAFEFMATRTELVAELEVPVTSYRYNDAPSAEQIDRVAFDEVGGGRDAANHLLNRGYRTVAFLSRHFQENRVPGTWAFAREEGWRSAIREATGEDGICFHLTDDDRGRVRPDAPRAMAEIVARRAIQHRGEVDAFVGIDDWSIAALLRAWNDAGLPTDALPPMVGFEDLPEARSPFVSSVRPPWEQLGEVAADLLWQRAVRQIDGPAVTRLVPMDVAARLSSRPEWRFPAVVG